MRVRPLFALLPVVALGSAGCIKVISSISSDSSGTPVGLLKMSMDNYAALKSFKAKYSWSDSFGQTPGGVGAVRTIEYESPNLFRASTSMKTGMSMTCISDGKKEVEYSSISGQPAMSNDPPTSLADASSMMMEQPMFCGTLLYKFFGGSANLDKLADLSKGQITFGKQVQMDGEDAHHVLFYAAGLYGHTDAVIGENTGKVYSISYDSEPLMKMAKDEGMGGSNIPSNSNTVESYSEIDFNPTFGTPDFAAVAPKGMTTTDASNPDGQTKPPVPLGSPAPNFTVTPLDGSPPVSLASLKGKAVLVDFWATWCPPCRESLPHTEAIFKDLGSQGLQVMTVSNEQADTIDKFIAKNQYTFPTFRDNGDTAEKAYGVNAIPTVLIIDKDGQLRNYFVGLQNESTLRDALKKIGIG